AVVGHRVERSDQPDVVRDVRLPEAVRLQPPEGHEADAGCASQGQGHRDQRAQGEGGDRHVPPAPARALGNDAAGRVSPFRRPDVRIRRVRRNTYQVRLPPEERVILRSLCGELRTLLAAEDPSVGRLFPPAYADDPAASGEY